MRPTIGSLPAPGRAPLSSLPTFRLPPRGVKAGAIVIAPDGRVFTEDAIGMALAMRDLMTDLRSAGGTTRGPRPFLPKDRSAFLSALDEAIRRLQSGRVPR
jgi:uncharacterized protein